jgi:long-chain acyl-CoA synthetase
MHRTHSSLVEHFDRIRHDTPTRPLIHLPLARTTLTAGDIWNGNLAQRSLLVSAGLGRDHLLLCAIGNRPEVFPLWLACRALGIALLPVDSGTTVAEIAQIAKRFGATAAIVPETGAAAELGSVHPFAPGLVRVAFRSAVAAPHLHAGAAVLKLTSGSTGLPKATFSTEEQLLADVDHITTAMGIRADDCQMACLPLSHAYGMGNLLLPLLVQGTAVVLREGFVPHQFMDDARTYDARVFPGVPFMFDHFKDHFPPGTWPRRLERLISAGARLDATTARGFHAAFGVKICSFYGTSETGGIAFDDSPTLAEEGTVGRPMPGVSVTLRPEDGAPVGGGRVHVAGAAVASGYVGSEGGDGFSAEGFLTGDFGRYASTGELVLCGRVSSFINVAGRKVQPEEIEATLRQMPGVADVRVIGAPDPIRGEQIVACIVPGGQSVGTLAVRQFCASRLAPYKIPRAVVPLERIPLTGRGKTDRRKLQQIVEIHLRGVSGAGVL